MQYVIEPERQIPVRGEYDVVVAGGGTAGIIAALAAAHRGARVLLLERGGFLGGHIPSQLLEHSEGWFDATGERLVDGLPQELVDRLAKAGASPGHVRDDTGYTHFRVPMNHEEFKSIVALWMAEWKVDFLLQSPVCAPILEDDAVVGVIVENKSGRSAYAARAVVDCTGDADVAALAGAEFLSTPGTDTQPVSILFKLGGVDHGALIDYVARHPDDFKLGVSPDALVGESHINLWGFGELLRQGYADGVLSLERNELHHSGWTRTGEAVINVTRWRADATDAEDLSRAEVELRRQVLEFLAFFRKYVPGCRDAFLAATAACVGVRESRRLAGVYVLTDEDVRQGRRFEDVIARGGFPMDSHDPRGKSMASTEPVRAGYDIPYRCLLPRRVDGLIVAGRCISAERRALASARITGTCMAMGQAAGTAAALAAVRDVTLRDLPVAALQAALRADGALL